MRNVNAHVRIGDLRARLGPAAHPWQLEMDVAVNRVRRKPGFGDPRPASAVRMPRRDTHSVRRNFEQIATSACRKRNVDRIVSAHIHRPAIVRNDGMTCWNDSDRVEPCSALRESASGEPRLFDWNAHASGRRVPTGPATLDAA